MNGENVEYELSLKDGLSPKVIEATKHAKGLEETLKSVGERALHVAEAFGISFAIFKGIEFVKEAKEEWEKLEFANSQLEAGLESTGHAAGITFEQLQESAQGFSHNLKFTQAQVEDMQSILLTFTSVTKDTFGDASSAVLDMATRLKTDASSAALQLGKALQDPVAGLGALHRVGVNVDELKKKFVSVTDTLQRQKLIIKELKTEFGGSAEAAAKADVSFRYTKSMHELSLMVGELATKFLSFLTPALEGFVSGIKNSIKWMEEHKDLMKAIGIGIAVAAGAWLVYRAVLLGMIAVQKIKAFWDVIQIASMYTEAGAAGGLSVAMTILTAIQYGLNAAMAANPVLLIITGLALATTAVVYCYNHFAKFRAVLWGVWETIKEFARIVGDIFMGVGKVIIGVLTLSPKKILEGFDQTLDAISNAGNRLGKAFKTGYDDGMADWDKDQNEKKEGLVPKGAPKPKALGQGAAIKEPKTKATGSKTVTINVTIKDVIGTYNSNVTNVKEGSNKLKDVVVKTLIEAVNDFQIVGGN